MGLPKPGHKASHPEEHGGGTARGVGASLDDALGFPSTPELGPPPAPTPYDDTETRALKEKALNDYWAAVYRSGPQSVRANPVAMPYFRDVAQVETPEEVAAVDPGAPVLASPPPIYGRTTVARASAPQVAGAQVTRAGGTRIDSSGEDESRALQSGLADDLKGTLDGTKPSAARLAARRRGASIAKGVLSSGYSLRQNGARNQVADVLAAKAAAEIASAGTEAEAEARERQQAQETLAGLASTMRAGDQAVFLEQARLDQQTGLFNAEAENTAARQLASETNEAARQTYATESGLNEREAELEAQRKRDEFEARFDADKFNANWANNFKNAGADRQTQVALANVRNRIEVALANMDAKNRDNWFRTQAEQTVRQFNADQDLRAQTANVQAFLESRKVDDAAKASFLGLMAQLEQMRQLAISRQDAALLQRYQIETQNLLALYGIDNKKAGAHLQLGLDFLKMLTGTPGAPSAPGGGGSGGGSVVTGDLAD